MPAASTPSRPTPFGTPSRRVPAAPAHHSLRAAPLALSAVLLLSPLAGAARAAPALSRPRPSVGAARTIAPRATCGDAAGCATVQGPGASYFAGAGCTGSEYAYWGTLVGTAPGTWDAQGQVGNSRATQTVRAYKDPNGTCHDDWSAGASLPGAGVVYRDPAGGVVKQGLAYALDGGFVAAQRDAAVSPAPPNTPPPDVTPPTLTVSPAAGTYVGPLAVGVTVSEPASVYYTLDGSTPTTANARYTAPVGIPSGSGAATLKLLGIDATGNASAVASYSYLVSPAAPAASPASGTYAALQTVALSAPGSPAATTIRYTTDGNLPTTSSAQYTAPLAVARSTTLKAVAIDPAGTPGPVATYSYAIAALANGGCGEATCNPVQGAYISFYTGPGCTGMELGSNGGAGGVGPASTWDARGLSGTAHSGLVLHSYADPATHVCHDEWPNGVTNAVDLVLIYRPVFVSPVAGTYQSPRTVTMSAANGVAIHYTTDGSTPTANSPQYTGPVAITGTTTLKVLGVDASGNTSAVDTYGYVIAPLLNGGCGEATCVPVSTASPYHSFFTGTGCTGTELGSNGGTGGVGPASTWDMRGLSGATHSGLLLHSYRDPANVCHDEWPNGVTNAVDLVLIYRPFTASLPSGTYTTSQIVTLSTAPGVTLHYTTDGSAPTSSSALYTGPISIAATTTLKVLGVDQVGNTSAVETYTYTISP